MTLSPLGQTELTELQEALPQLEAQLRGAGAAYAQEKPRFDLQREVFPAVREEEIGMIRVVGRIQAQIEETRQRIAWLSRER